MYEEQLARERQVIAAETERLEQQVYRLQIDRQLARERQVIAAETQRLEQQVDRQIDRYAANQGETGHSCKDTET